jgi:hypothetical protein
MASKSRPSRCTMQTHTGTIWQTIPSNVCGEETSSARSGWKACPSSRTTTRNASGSRYIDFFDRRWRYRTLIFLLAGTYGSCVPVLGKARLWRGDGWAHHCARSRPARPLLVRSSFVCNSHSSVLTQNRARMNPFGMHFACIKVRGPFCWVANLCSLFSSEI